MRRFRFMAAGPHHEIRNLTCAPGELSFEAHIGDFEQRVWMHTASEMTPNADAALAACVLPAMRSGGTLSMEAPVSRRMLRTQREYQAIQRAWSHGWELPDFRLREVEVRAPVRPAATPQANGRVAVCFSGGVDSWSAVLDEPDVTDLIFVRGVDLIERFPQHREIAGEVEARLREAADAIGLPLHVVETNLRELADPLVPWEGYFGCATTAVALFLAPLFERVLYAGDTDYEVQVPVGSSRLVGQLWSTEELELVEAGGRLSRVERTAALVDEPAVQRTLRTCWENPGGAYNCGRCRKCLMTMVTLETLGARERFATFPPELDLDLVAGVELARPITLSLWEDILDATRAAGRPDLERAVEAAVSKGRRRLDLPPGYRRRDVPGPPKTIRVAAIVPVWRQARYLAGAVGSALAQEIGVGVGVVIVNDGCPDPESDRIAQALRDAHPDRVAYVHQPNRGLPAARNAGIRRALARWPHLEAVFPLDADNRLSPHTLAKLWEVLEDRPEADWASPNLEYLGMDGVWRMPQPFLAYRQLFTNQSDAGSLIRRRVFEAGVEFDETMREGFEDWEFFLRATLAGFRGTQAGSCGFLYRRREDSMLAQAQARAAAIEAGMRRRHETAYSQAELARREHAEAPRFGLVRCDGDDVLLTAACDLPPHRVPLDGYLRPRPRGSDVPPLEAHVPAITVLATGATLAWLEEQGLLADVLLRMQVEVHAHAVVGLRIGREPSPRRPGWKRRRAEPPGPAALALRTRTVAKLAAAGEYPRAGVFVETRAGRLKPPQPLDERLLDTTLDRMRAAMHPGAPLIATGSQAQYFEHRHVDLLETGPPWSGAEGASAAAVTA